MFTEEPLPADDPLLTCEQVVLTPHCADTTPEGVDLLNGGAVDNILAFLRGEPRKRHQLTPLSARLRPPATGLGRDIWWVLGADLMISTTVFGVQSAVMNCSCCAWVTTSPRSAACTRSAS